MTKSAFLLALLASALALSLPAQAVPLTRTYVSQAGNDADPCTSIQPCRHFANAYAVTAANGIITALDPGGYGPLAITTAVIINGQGWGSITAPSGGTGITVNAGASNQVTLIGLTVDGAGAGANGILFNSGGSLTITNCVVQNFVGTATAGNGILMQPTSGTLNFTITNTTATNNENGGIYYFPPSGSASATGVIDHVVATSNGRGFAAETNLASGGSVAIAISNSIASANSVYGLFAQNGAGTLTVSIDNVSINDNTSYGIFAVSTTKVLLGRSVVTGNGIGIQNNTSPNTLFTYKDNRINLNGTDLAGAALNTTLALQ